MYSLFHCSVSMCIEYGGNNFVSVCLIISLSLGRGNSYDILLEF